MPSDQDFSLGGIKVLVVDDDRNTGEILTVVFGFSDIETTIARSVGEALAIFAVLRPDVVISDIGMPGQNGYDLIQHIRALAPAEGGQVPAIALTGFADGETRQRALSAGYQQHVAKPVGPYEVLAMVRELHKAQPSSPPNYESQNSSATSS